MAGESPADAISRELREETLDAIKVRKGQQEGRVKKTMGSGCETYEGCFDWRQGRIHAIENSMSRCLDQSIGWLAIVVIV